MKQINGAATKTRMDVTACKIKIKDTLVEFMLTPAYLCSCGSRALLLKMVLTSSPTTSKISRLVRSEEDDIMFKGIFTPAISFILPVTTNYYIFTVRSHGS